MKAVLLAVTLTLVASPAPTQPPATATLLEDRAEVETNASQYAAAIRDANDAAAMYAAKGDARGRARAGSGLGNVYVNAKWLFKLSGLYQLTADG